QAMNLPSVEHVRAPNDDSERVGLATGRVGFAFLGPGGMTAAGPTCCPDCKFHASNPCPSRATACWPSGVTTRPLSGLPWRNTGVPSRRTAPVGRSVKAGDSVFGTAGGSAEETTVSDANATNATRGALVNDMMRLISLS